MTVVLKALINNNVLQKALEIYDDDRYQHLLWNQSRILSNRHQLPVDLNPIDEMDEMVDIDEEDVEYDQDEQAEIIQHMLLSPMVCTVIEPSNTYKYIDESQTTNYNIDQVTGRRASAPFIETRVHDAASNELEEAPAFPEPLWSDVPPIERFGYSTL